MRLRIALAVIVFCAGCATTVPDAIHTPPAPDISVTQARQDPGAYVGKPVRWGGTIARVENRATETAIEIVARELGGKGRPRSGDRSAGRFIARVSEFLDPAVYTEGRHVTVAGTLVDSTSGRIGDHPYRYPVVKAETVYLWEPLSAPSERRYYRDPFYDPFYDPFWYPWRAWPYYGPWPYHYR